MGILLVSGYWGMSHYHTLQMNRLVRWRWVCGDGHLSVVKLFPGDICVIGYEERIFEETCLPSRWAEYWLERHQDRNFYKPIRKLGLGKQYLPTPWSHHVLKDTKIEFPKSPFKNLRLGEQYMPLVGFSITRTSRTLFLQALSKISNSARVTNIYLLLVSIPNISTEIVVLLLLGLLSCRKKQG